MLYLKDLRALVQLEPQMVLTNFQTFNVRMYNGLIMWKEQEHMLFLMKECEST
jgi:hypothetical protein